MAKIKRPKDPNQNAHLIVKIATGQTDDIETPKKKLVKPKTPKTKKK